MFVPPPPLSTPLPQPLHILLQTPYPFHNATYRVKPLVPIQNQRFLAPFPFQSALTVIEFTITFSQWGNFASKPISLAVGFYTVPGCESWVNNETVCASPPYSSLSIGALRPRRLTERGLPHVGSLERCSVNNLFMLCAGMNNSGHPS